MMTIERWISPRQKRRGHQRGWQVPRAALCLLLMLAALPLAAQDDAPDNGLSEAELQQRNQEILRRQQAIADLQSEFGVYNPGLIEAYTDFAAYYAELGDYASAVKVYDSALQVARVSSGLYSEEQLPILQKLIDSNAQLKDWAEVDKLQHLRYYISSRLYTLDDKPYLLAAITYGEWKLRVVRENLLDLGSRGLAVETEDLSTFYNRVITNMETQTDASQEDLLQMIYGKSLADMALARVIAATPFTAFEGTASRYINQTRCQNVINAQGQVVRQCFNVQVENPRYRQSQQDAKQFAVSQYTREINRSIEKLQTIVAQSTDLSAEQRQSLETHIGELQTESTLLGRSSRRRLLF